MTLHPVFGGTPDENSQTKITKSSNHNGDIFINLEPTSTALRDIPPKEGKPSFNLLSVFFPPEGREPKNPLPTDKLDKTQLKNGDFVWFGHSSVLFLTDNKVFLTDPIFYNASPVPGFVRPYKMTNRPQIKDLPNIDAVLISHDHYDHLDYEAIQEMENKVKHFYVPLGVKAHLQRWGVSDDKITEFDWYESTQIGDVKLILTPSRHFSGRGLTNRNSTLWASWVVKSPQMSLFFSGDSGYGKHYKEIGKRFEPFDVALMEDGQYNERWPDIHMMPEQSVQASIDLKAKHVLPVHWGKYNLSLHKWKEPIQRFLAEADKNNIITLTPKIGQQFTLENPPTPQTQGKWWKGVE